MFYRVVLPLLNTTPGKVDFLNMKSNEKVVVGWAWGGMVGKLPWLDFPYRKQVLL